MFDGGTNMRRVSVTELLTREDLVSVGMCCKKAHSDMTEYAGLDEEGTNIENCCLSEFFDSE